jgi:glutathione synthase/RimK-type ligase-like ATP-grasp enzyme
VSRSATIDSAVPSKHTRAASAPIAFVTSSETPGINADDRLAADALSALDVTAVAAAWDDTAVDWRAFRAIVFRACWNYHTRLDRFLEWIDRLETPAWNAPDIVRWNIDKRYLRSLEGADMPLAPTAWIERGVETNLRWLLDTRGWTQAVVKPAVSADGHGTRLVTEPTEDDQRALDEILQSSAALVQPLVTAVRTSGEASLIFFEGEFSHAALRRPAQADFRIQERFGGTVEPFTAPDELVRRAATVAGRVPGQCLYARVDVVPAESGPILMECETIEPSLYLSCAPRSAERFARAIQRRLERLPA